MEKEQEKLAVETLSLTKTYKGKAAVNHLNMKVRQGAIYGFIGRNGAGKSTTLKMLCGLAEPTEGEIRIFGKTAGDPYAARRIGCLIEATGLYPGMTARQNMMMKAKCMGLTDEKSVDKALASTGLTETGGKKVRYFSMGMKQRLGIALALLGNPDLLILDEPINGLDPEGTREVRQLLLALCQEEGKTLIISSHILGELSKIATHYGIIKEGHLVEQIDREHLENNCRDYFQIEVNDSKRALPLILEHAQRARGQAGGTLQAPDAPANQADIQAEVMEDGKIRLYNLKDGAWLNQLLIENGIQVYSSGFHQMNLEEYFLKRMDNLSAGETETPSKGGENHV